MQGSRKNLFRSSFVSDDIFISLSGFSKFLVKMATKRAKAISVTEDRDLQYKVNYTLDVVANDLIQSGQLPAMKSYVLKSPEMKALMKRQVSNINSRRLSFDETAANNVTFKPLSLPIGIVTKFAANASMNKKKAGSKSSFVPAVSEIKRVQFVSHRSPATPKAPVRISHSKTIQLSTNHHQKDKKTNNILQPITNSSNTIVQEAFSARADLKEFTNDEISLDVQDHTITITGYRPRKGANNSRKVTEVVQVPDHIVMDRLLIGRRTDGSLVVEENFHR